MANYSNSRDTKENLNQNEKYSETGESEWSRGSTIPYDEDETLSERHYNLAGVSFKQDLTRFKDKDPFQRPLSNAKPNHAGKGPKGYRRSDDRIKEDVSEALFQNYNVDATDIEVSVTNGCVYLRGHVDSREAKRTAELCVEGISGVEDVQNELRIEKRPDTSHDGLIQNRTGLN